MEDKTVELVIKWKSKEYTMKMENETTLLKLKEEIEKQTKVSVLRQKLTGISLKHLRDENTKLGEMNLKKKQKIMLIGEAEEEIVSSINKEEQISLLQKQVQAVQEENVVEEETVAFHLRKQVLERIEKRVLTYNFKILNPPRPEIKKLLV